MNSFGSKDVDNSASHGEGSMEMLETPITQTPEANTRDISMEEETDANGDFCTNMQNSSSMASGISEWTNVKVLSPKDTNFKIVAFCKRKKTFEFVNE